MKAFIWASFTLLLLGFTSCKTKQTTTTSTENVQKKYDEKNFDASFKGLGTEPFWNIELNDDFIVYKNMEGVSEVFTISTGIDPNNNSTQTIKASNKNNEIMVVLSPGECSDGMSDNSFDYKVAVKLSGKDVALDQTGCGRYVLPKKLQGKWELNQFKGADILENKYLKTPYLSFDGDDFQFSGNASCNGIKGAVVLTTETMKFPNVAATRMMCVHENMEADFLKALNAVTSYKVVDNELQLFTNNELVMKFAKK